MHVQQRKGWQKSWHYRTPLLGIALALLVSSCDAPVAKKESLERTLPLMGQAAEFERGGDWVEATRLYEEVVAKDPSVALAFFHLGLLAHDNSQDYINAIFYYRHYLKMRPQAEKAQMVTERIQKAEQLLAAKLNRRNATVSATAVVGPPDDLLALEQLVKELRAENEALVAERLRLEMQGNQDERKISSLERRLMMLEGVDIAPPRRDVRAEAAQDVTPSAVKPRSTRGTYIVKRGDNLSKISRAVYGSEVHYRRIADANSEMLENGSRLTVGQELIIP